MAGKNRSTAIVVLRHRGTVKTSARWVQARLDAQKGGRSVRHRRKLTSIRARHMAIKMNHPWGRKVRRRMKRQPDIKRAPLREKYSAFPPTNAQHIWFADGQWYIAVVRPGRQWMIDLHRWVPTQQSVVVRITERTALRRLGHLLYPRKNVVPTKVISALPGTRLATYIGQEV